jgi:hypothetical protein
VLPIRSEFIEIAIPWLSQSPQIIRGLT